MLTLLRAPDAVAARNPHPVSGDSSSTDYVGTKGVDDLTVSVEGPKWVFSKNAATQEAPIAPGDHTAATPPAGNRKRSPAT